MLKKLLQVFGGKKSDSLKLDKVGNSLSLDLQTAIAVILVEVASADKGIDPKEADAVCALMQEELGLPEDELPALIQTAISARKEQGKIDSFVKSINESFHDGQRQRLFGLLWKVVIADGKVEKFEQRFAVQMRNRLQLSEEQAEAARRLAEQGGL
ncbi:MAG: TerB family tellurite resistance protein [Oligoflexia bacterium]|nr:TerB family tellurite resistance protein [Oligoflexia bacterium]